MVKAKQETREQKIARITQAVREGSYTVDSRLLAEELLERYSAPVVGEHSASPLSSLEREGRLLSRDAHTRLM